MVRHATPADRPVVVALLREFHAAAGCTFAFDPVRAAALFTAHMTPGACVLVTDDLSGILMATAGDHPFGMGKVARETFWFVSPAARGRAGIELLDAYEVWAREQGCVSVGMTALASNDVSAIYRRRGYAVAETHFTKAL